MRRCRNPPDDFAIADGIICRFAPRGNKDHRSPSTGLPLAPLPPGVPASRELRGANPPVPRASLADAMRVGPLPMRAGSSFTNQTLAQIELWSRGENYENKVYTLPKHLDEKVARLHLAKIGVKLTELRPEQAAYIGVAPKGRSSPSTPATDGSEAAARAIERGPAKALASARTVSSADIRRSRARCPRSGSGWPPTPDQG